MIFDECIEVILVLDKYVDVIFVDCVEDVLIECVELVLVLDKCVEVLLIDCVEFALV